MNMQSLEGEKNAARGGGGGGGGVCWTMGDCF